MENLNKENFWNEMFEKYPLSVTEFCIWIDGYKKRVEWDKLFNGGIVVSLSVGAETKAPKFHEIPLEMQFGIWMRYVVEAAGEGEEQNLKSAMLEVEELLKYRQVILSNKPK